MKEKMFTIKQIEKIVEKAKERGDGFIKFQYGVIPFTGDFTEIGTSWTGVSL